MTESILFALLRAAVNTDSNENIQLSDLTEENLTAVYDLAKRHDMAHLVGHSLDTIGYSGMGELTQGLRKRTMQAVYRCARQQDEFERISQILENAQISYIPLKGTLIRDWYPEPWMRTSTDIDILIHNEDLDAAIRILSQELGYRHKGTVFHDASLFSPSGVHLELHFKLADTTIPEKVRIMLSDVWDHVSPSPGYSYRFDMDADWFYLYHIFHMAKHLVNGGCGIKPFLDLWIMKREKGYCVQRFDSVLSRCGLLTAAQAAETLSEVWFSGKAMDDVSRRLASFVLAGGVHGTLDGNVVVGQVRKGGKFQSIWLKVFLPYDMMKELYPILRRHKWLLPAVQVLRWFKLLFGGRFRRTANILWKNITASGDAREDTGRLLRDLDLL